MRQPKVGTARGGSALNTAIAVAVMAVVVITFLRVVPAYARAYEFRDSMRTQAKFAGIERKSEELIRKELHDKARSLDLPITPEQIRVSTIPGGIDVNCRFRLPVDLFLLNYTLNFDFNANTTTAY